MLEYAVHASALFTLSIDFNNPQKPIRSIRQCPIDTEGHRLSLVQRCMFLRGFLCRPAVFIFRRNYIYNINRRFLTSILRLGDKIPRENRHREINNRVARNRRRATRVHPCSQRRRRRARARVTSQLVHRLDE